MAESEPRIVGDRLYGISMRPHELALYGDRVAFQLRYSPIFDDPDEEATTHFKLLVLEVGCELPPDSELGVGERRLELVKCGWELEVATDHPCATARLPERPDEVPLLLGRVAETVNELARRAGLEAPLGPEVTDRLVAHYRDRGKADRAGPG